MSYFTSHHRRLILALGKAAIPGGKITPAYEEASIDRLAKQLGGLPEFQQSVYLKLLETTAIFVKVASGTALENTPTENLRKSLGIIFENSSAGRSFLRMITAPMKWAHFDNPDLHAAFGAAYRCDQVVEEPSPHLQSVFGPKTFDESEIECDVVVVGTGAGGAVVAKELAERGFAVLMIEKGKYFRREMFNRPTTEAIQNMYFQNGTHFSLGLPPIYMPFGQTVGGTTTINMGSSYRAPERIFRGWQDAGVPLSREEMDPHYDRVESMLGVEPGKSSYLGKIAEIIARGCDALGYDGHGPVPRNAPNCDGQGTCGFGCPSDARRSTNVSYVPAALRAGALLLTEFDVTAIRMEGDRATGLTAVPLHSEGHPKSIQVKAGAVVISAGSVHTPVLLKKSGFNEKTYPFLGRNLSIHPAVTVLACMEEEVRGYQGVPQGYGVHQFHDEGFLMEGGFMPLDLMAANISPLGHRFTSILDRFNHLAFFGGLAADTHRGRVVLDDKGGFKVVYFLHRHDVQRLTKLQGYLVEIFLAAGAHEVFPMVGNWPSIRNKDEFEEFKKKKHGKLDMEVSAFHPLGSAKMGPSKGNSVVGFNHAVHGTKGLYVVDGSVMPSPLAVNPQLTIMAMAHRAAEKISIAISQSVTTSSSV